MNVMIDEISLFYNIHNLKITDQSSYYYLCDEHYEYYLYQAIYDASYYIELCNFINTICHVYDIVTGINNSYIFNSEGKRFIMLRKVPDYHSYVITVKDIVRLSKFNRFYKECDYITLWNRFLLDNENTCTSDYLYSGLLLNGITYLKSYINNNDYFHISYVHRRVYYGMKSDEFYNPMNIVEGYSVRDISEYIKSVYYSNIDYKNIFKWYLREMINILTYNDYILLFSRFFFNSIYFDNKKIIPSTRNDYISFLKDVYFVITGFIFIPQVEYLLR